MRIPRLAKAVCVREYHFSEGASGDVRSRSEKIISGLPFTSTLIVVGDVLVMLVV